MGDRRVHTRAEVSLTAALLVAAAALTPLWAQDVEAPYPDGNLSVISGFKVLHVAGSPREMGEQHGRLLGDEVRRMIKDLITEGEGSYASSYERLIKGARKMEPFVPREFRLELRALARTADVKYEDLLLAQLFGDVWRGMYCTSYAVYGDATENGECIVGRNMDYWDHGVTKYGAVLIHYTPDRGVPFMTITWAGIINGWTLMNAEGVCVANNTAYGTGSVSSLEGISTCFMLRKVAQYARNVDEGVEIARTTPRACATNMIIAGGRPHRACIVEFDHVRCESRWAVENVVFAANDFKKLYQQTTDDDAWDDGDSYGGTYYSRYQKLAALIRENYGKIDRAMNFAGFPGIAIPSMNLHSAALYPDDLSFEVSMGKIPACEGPYRAFRMTPRGIVSAEGEWPTITSTGSRQTRRADDP